MEATEPQSPRGTVTGHASFLHRGTPPLQKFGMDLLDGLVWFFSFLLRLGGRPLRRALISLLGALAWWLDRGHRHVALVNLDLVYGNALSEDEKRRLVRGMFRHFARITLDSFFEDVYWPPERIRRVVGKIDAQAFEQARALGRGYMIVGPHLGNIEMAQRVMAAFGIEAFVLYKGFKNAWFDRLVGQKRLKHGNSLIEVPGTRHKVVDGRIEFLTRVRLLPEIDSVWARNAAIVNACDQYAHRTNLFLPFLGVDDVPIQAGALRYAIKNRIPIVMLTVIYEDDERIRWIEGGPLLIEDKGGLDETVKFYVGEVMRWFEQEIRKYPEQYAWGHRRFPRHHYRTMRQD